MSKDDRFKWKLTKGHWRKAGRQPREWKLDKEVKTVREKMVEMKDRQRVNI